MIRLIASDMDGTLLDEDGQLPPETIGLIRALGERGVRFCVSSGRRFDYLCDLFGPVANEMDYVSSNGTEVHVGNELIDRETFSRAAILRLADLVEGFDLLHLTCGVHGRTYCLDRDPAKFERFLEQHGSWAPYIQGRPAPDEGIVLGVVLCSDISQVVDMAYVLNLEMGDEFIFQRTASVAIDFTPRTVSKATGLAKLMRFHGLQPDEVMVYGDAMNDYDIMRLCGHPVCVDNALYGIRAISERMVGSNAEHGVPRDMARILAEIDADADADATPAGFASPIGSAGGETR